MKARRGFTMIEMIVVIAVIAILIAVIAPNLGSIITYVTHTACDGDVATLTKEFQLEYTSEIAQGIKPDGDAIMQQVLSEHDGSDGTGICPAGGKYVYAINNSTGALRMLACNKHAVNVVDPTDPSTDYVDSLRTLMDDLVDTLPKYPNTNKPYLEITKEDGTKVKYDFNTSTIDSTATTGDRTKFLLDKLKLQGDFTFKITTTNADKNNMSRVYYWAYQSIEGLEPGTKVPIIRYNTDESANPGGNYVVTTSTVKKHANGYNVLEGEKGVQSFATYEAAFAAYNKLKNGD